MSTSLASLRDRPYPQLWSIFQWITTFPRPSGSEQQFRDTLINRAVSHGWAVRRDAAGNVVFAVDGRGALANAPTLVLQGHLDMVCEKNHDVEHDFLKDPIPAYLDGDWIRSRGTTLGADNGIAIALALALAEADADDRVPLELLFTIEEETGLIGACNLDPDVVTGRRILNLDSEEDGIITIGCAGGVDLTATFLRPTPTDFADTIAVSISGCRGGHSGVDVHEGRANAIAVAANLALRLRQSEPQTQLVHFTGGSKRNAIPREAALTLAGCDLAVARKHAAVVQQELRRTEPDAVATVVENGPDRGGTPFAVVEFIQGCPIGIIRREPGMPDLVRTSNSIGVVTADADACTVIAAGRSSSESELGDLVATTARYADEAGGRFSSANRYPGWQPLPDSPFAAEVAAAWEKALEQRPQIAAIHAGLECGVIGQRLNTDQVVSCGPTIHNAHSPDEQLSITSAERVLQFLHQLASNPADV